MKKLNLNAVDKALEYVGTQGSIELILVVLFIIISLVSLFIHYQFFVLIIIPIASYIILYFIT